METIIKMITGNWAILLAIGGAWAVVYATVRVKVPAIDRRLRKLENMDLVTTASCADMQHNCQKLICAKIDVIKNDLEKMDDQRQAARHELFVELKIISKFMGQVEQFMAQHIKVP
jgi:hypothetical protein